MCANFGFGALGAVRPLPVTSNSCTALKNPCTDVPARLTPLARIRYWRNSYVGLRPELGWPGVFLRIRADGFPFPLMRRWHVARQSSLPRVRFAAALDGLTTELRGMNARLDTVNESATEHA